VSNADGPSGKTHPGNNADDTNYGHQAETTHHNNDIFSAENFS
jgi:hypothetical protein